MIETSIVIPTYRRLELVSGAVASCVAQRGVAAPFEIVVVDNDPDGSARPVIERLAEENSVPIRYVGELRPGISHARNAGVANAAGRYIAFLDDDEAADPGWLAAFLATARSCAADAVIGPVYPRFPADMPEIDDYRLKVYTRDAKVPTGTLLPRWGGIGNTLLDKERCFVGDQPFDPGLGLCGGEDTLFLRQLKKRGRKVVWCAEAKVWETVPLERLAPQYLVRRRFHSGQLTTYVRTAVKPSEPGWAAFWMAVGCAQVAVYAPAALALRLLGRDPFPAMARAAGGLGKILWHPRLHPRLYR